MTSFDRDPKFGSVIAKGESHHMGKAAVWYILTFPNPFQSCLEISTIWLNFSEFFQKLVSIYT